MLWWICVLGACTADAPSSPAEPSAAPEVAQVAAEPEPTEPVPVEPTEPRYAATHVLIPWSGAVDAPPTVTRTREEARALAEELRARAVAGEPIEALARAHSESPSAPRGGKLGVYATGTMVPAFEAAVAAVPAGAIGPLVETPFGWHVVRRDPVIEARAAHVLVTWKGAWRSGATRSREEARARAEEALAALRGGTPFEEVARRWSDDATASIGGDLGLVAPGQMIPAFEEALFGLEPGATSDLVETPYGFHLIRRGP